MNSIRRQRSAGFSLLEMVVAIAILGLALGALYQAAGGATRNVRTDERYAYATELAQSLLANHTRVPAQGVSERGETAGGFVWEVVTRPVEGREGRERRASTALHEIQVIVAWSEGLRSPEVVLNSVVEGKSR
ncbi:MAG: prepilin-type N-terminal cleavage/methylation domain-containing protein [Halioglobus sp.]